MTLTLDLAIELARLPRRACPRCQRRRVLYRISATGNDRLVGHGEAACAECAGLRARVSLHGGTNDDR